MARCASTALPRSPSETSRTRCIVGVGADLSRAGRQRAIGRHGPRSRGQAGPGIPGFRPQRRLVDGGEAPAAHVVDHLLRGAPAAAGAHQRQDAEVLQRIHAVYAAREPIREGACGAPAPIELISIGQNPEVTFSPPPVVRCDLVLRNFAMLYPAAFAPGPVFALSGWYDDAPWGTGFERPSRHEIEFLFAKAPRDPQSPLDTLDAALHAWGLDSQTEPLEQSLASRVAANTVIVVAGRQALVALVRSFIRNQRSSVRNHVVLVTDDPALRHVLGITCALVREAGLPWFVDMQRGENDSLETWALREKKRLGGPRAELALTSPDISAAEQEAVQALAQVLGATESMQLAG